MSTKDHIIKNEDARNIREGGLGSKYNENYASAYAASPIHKGEMTDETVRAAWINGVQTENVLDAFEAHGKAIAGGIGNRFDKFNVDFAGSEEDPVPNIAENTSTADGKAFGAGAGAPTTAYIPPLTSPGPGSLAASDQPAFTGTTPDPDQQNEFGSGLGGLANPSETSPEIAKQDVDPDTILLSGRSYETSAG